MSTSITKRRDIHAMSSPGLSLRDKTLLSSLSSLFTVQHKYNVKDVEPEENIVDQRRTGS